MTAGTHDGRVRFLNVDVELYGDFDRAAVGRGFGEAIVILHEGSRREGDPALVFELNAVRPTVERTLTELIALVRALPEDARSAWNAATRRAFDIGISSGPTPHSTCRTIDANVLTVLGGINADLVVTVYGAEPPTGSS